jgi:hypothetical protein
MLKLTSIWCAATLLSDRSNHSGSPFMPNLHFANVIASNIARLAGARATFCVCLR